MKLSDDVVNEILKRLPQIEKRHYGIMTTTDYLDFVQFLENLDLVVKGSSQSILVENKPR